MPLQDYFQKNLIAELGLADLPEDKKTEMILKIGNIIQQNILLRILSELSEKDKTEFDKVLAQGDDRKILAWLQAKLPNFDELVKDEVAKFKQTSISRMQEVLK